MPDLNCTEFEAHLEQLVEDHRTLEDLSEETTDPQAAAWRDLRSHANTCSHCRPLWNDFALLERVIVPWKECLPPVNLADAVMARWKDDSHAGNQTAPSRVTKQDRPSSSKRFLWQMLLVVAVAILASVPLWFSPEDEDGLPTTTYPVTETGSQNPLGDQSDLPETLSKNPPKDLVQEPDMDWDTLAQDARSAYWVLASDTADSFASVSVLMPPPKPAKTPEPIRSPKPKKGWTEELGSGLKPISQDIGKASGFLLDALPTL